MGTSSETVRSGSCLVRELWRVAAACGITREPDAYGTKNVYITSFPVPVGMYILAERC